MSDDFDFVPDAAYTMDLSPPDRPGAATDISIRVDDGADIVIDMGSKTAGRINAYLTVDQAEELMGALAEIVRLPSDRTGAVNSIGPDFPR